jgi:hypothetical protein
VTDIEFAPDLAPVGLPEPELVPVDEFIAVEEEGAEALVGGPGAAVIPEGGDVMLYGDGGAGKTTLSIDLGFHLAAGDDWLGLPIARPASVLIIENEGPRPLFRAKLRRKREGWAGSALDDRLHVLERPWGEFSFDDPLWREALAAQIKAFEIDVLIAGPVTRSGMNEAGTLQEVRDFMMLVDDLRTLTGRRLTVVLIHHESKSGQVSGAWEAAGDTLCHVQGQGHGRTRLFFQKARWASAQHGVAMSLLWAEGEGFAVEEREELDDEAIAELICEQVRENAGTGWTKVEAAVKGARADRVRAVRDGLLAAGKIVNVDGDELRPLQERRAAHLYLAGDPTIRHLRPARDADGTQAASLWAEGEAAESASCVLPYRGRRDVDAAAAPPRQETAPAPRAALPGEPMFPVLLAEVSKAGHLTELEAQERYRHHRLVERAIAAREFEGDEPPPPDDSRARARLAGRAQPQPQPQDGDVSW